MIQERGVYAGLGQTSEVRILSVDKLEGGLVLAFSDGRCLFYPASLLFAIMPEATELTGWASDEEQAAMDGVEPDM